jgi:quercetin dioxygenase-like cupin family protein
VLIYSIVMDKKALKEKLAQEGFSHIYEWHDDPGTEYPAHSHKGNVAMYILEGSLTFWLDAHEVVLRQGDRFDVPIGREHSAKVGTNGCTFLVGEMVEGDS